MRLIIDISNYDVEWINNAHHIPDEINSKIADAIIIGLSLPEHHGDLIDRDKLVPHCKFRGDCWADKCDSCSDYAVDYSDIRNATPIIGAERSDKDGDSD